MNNEQVKNINLRSYNHWLAIKLYVINDICQAIACGSDYFHCALNSQVSPSVIPLINCY